jgi:hypothetical protein
VIELGENFFGFDDKKQNKITIEEKKKLIDQTHEIINDTVQRIKSGDFKPNPKEIELCTDCQWRDLCRAPHLNQI